MEEDLIIIKKIYINDYVINSTLLKNSLSKLLVNTLSNKFYKTNKIQKKVANILNCIDNIFQEDSNGNKIFNLAYQPYNQFKIANDYKKNIFNKKWIIPIINERKTLDESVLEVVDGWGKYKKSNANKLLIQNENGDAIYKDVNFNINQYENHFENVNNLDNNTEFINLHPYLEKIEVNILDNNHIYNFNNPNNISNNNVPCKVIRQCENLCYSIKSNHKINKDESGKVYNKTIEDSYFEVRNILENENINIKQFLILNPLKLLHTNYNIYLGNTISYLNEIVYSTDLLLNDIINNHNKNIESLDLYGNEFNVINKDELLSTDNYIFDYLKIIKNLNQVDNIYSIRILKYIYNVFGYDLNKIPYCYISYLQNILQSNILDYINKNTVIAAYLFKRFNLYLNEDVTENTTIKYIQELYNIDNIIYNKDNDSIYNVLNVNTFDKGLLYYLDQYNKYLDTVSTTKYPEVKNVELLDNTVCENYRIVKIYNTTEDFDSDINKFIEPKYSTKNYIIEYSDLITVLENDNITLNLFNNPFYIIDDIIKINEKNSLTNKVSVLTEEQKMSVLNFIKTHKLYLYELLFNKTDIDSLYTDIIYSKLACFKYVNKKAQNLKYYIQIPYTTISNNNLIYILKEQNIYEYIDGKLNNPQNINNINSLILQKCNDNMENKSIHKISENINNIYTSLNNLDIDEYRQTQQILLTEARNNNNYNNFILSKPASIIESTLYFKNIYKISHYIYNIDTQETLDYLNKYKVPRIENKTSEELQEINDLSPFQTVYTKDIKKVNKRINEVDTQNIWGYVHKYINEYELISHIIEDGDKYNRAYYKLWELILDLDILDRPDFKLISLAEAPGNFVKCVQNNKPSDWNDYIICTLLDDKNTIGQNDFMIKYKDYIFGNPLGKLTIPDNPDFKGDLTNFNDINTFINHITVNDLYADLITADGGIDKGSDEEKYLLEEYIHLPLFLGETITALFTQKIGGTFILKMYDIIDNNSANILHLLSAFYNINISKPYNSRPCNTEKYVICSDFKGIPEEYKCNIKNNLFKMLNSIRITKPEGSYVYFNILDNLPINEKNMEKIKDFNNSITVKTQSLYLQHLYDIIKTNETIQINLIKTYFGKKSNFNLRMILNSEDNENKGYFIKKIESCIQLATYMKLKNQPLKSDYIEFYKLIKNFKNSVKNTNLYPPHFKKVYEINEEKNISIRTNNIIKFVEKYCIYYESSGKNKMIDYNILKLVELFINNKEIKPINHNIINILRENQSNLEKLEPYLEALCKITDIYKLFNLYNDTVISLIKNLQNNIRIYLGYYLCKYTYYPLYPKYKIYENVVDQVNLCGVLYNSHYICCYSGDRLDMEEFDDFMADNILRSNTLSLFEQEEQQQNKQYITSIYKGYNKDYTLEQNVCAFILNKYTINLEDKLFILNNVQYAPVIDAFENIDMYYKYYTTSLNNIYDGIQKPKKKLKNASEGIQNPDDKMFYKYFHIDVEKLTENIPEEHIETLPKIVEALELYSKENRVQNKITHKQPDIDKQHPLILHIVEIFLLKQMFKKCGHIIFYTLVLLNNHIQNFDKIYAPYLNFENQLIQFIYKNSTELFNSFKSIILGIYEENIIIPDNFSLDTTIHDLLEANVQNPIVTDLLKTHIKVYTEDEKVRNNWNWKEYFNQNTTDKSRDKKINALKTSNTVLEFLNNCYSIDFFKLEFKIIMLLKENKFKIRDISGLKLNNYIDKNLFESIFNDISTTIKGNYALNTTNNIENNILPHRETLEQINILSYTHYNSHFIPNYDENIIENISEKDKYPIFHAMKYLLLYVYEIDNPNRGKKRFFEYNKEDTTYKCIYTNKSKKDILNDIQSISKEELFTIKDFIIQNNITILNKKEFIGKNTLSSKIFSSMINNLSYTIDDNNIDILYKFITLYYNTYKSNLSDEEKINMENMVMTFYNDPIDNIIRFLNVHNKKQSDNFNDFVKTLDYDINIDDVIQNIYSSVDSFIYDKVNNLSISNTRTLETLLKDEIGKLNEEIKKHNINVPYENITFHNLTLFVNDMKKRFSNIANLSYVNDSNITTGDMKIILKSRYKNISKYYDNYEYNKLIEIIQNDLYSANINNHELDYLQIIFNNILESLQVNISNIYINNKYASLAKYLLLYKIHKILLDNINKFIQKDYIFIISPLLQEKYYIHQSSIEKSKKGKPLLQNESIVDIEDKYFDLFKEIVNTSINNTNSFNNAIYDLNPEDIHIDGSSINFDNLDFNDVQGQFEDSMDNDRDNAE